MIRTAILTIVVLIVLFVGYRVAFTDRTIITAFTSDGCSAWPDGTMAEKSLWLRCCTTHDKSYWRGGTYAERKTADQALQSCVADVGKPKVAAVMLAGVRVGGSPWWPTAFRWGYGWPWGRGYRALSPEENNLVDAALSD